MAGYTTQASEGNREPGSQWCGTVVLRKALNTEEQHCCATAPKKSLVQHNGARVPA